MGKFVAVWPGGEAEYANYYPAEQDAKQRAYSKVVYRGVRGLEVHVWPLT